MRRPAWLSSIPMLLTGSARDPAPVVARIREKDPVCWLPGYDAWLVSRHEDVRGLFVSPLLTADSRAYERYIEPTIPGAGRWLSAMPFRSATSDPLAIPRRFASVALTPRAIARAEDRIREVVERFAAPLRGRRGTVDLMAEFTIPTATMTIGRILGVPPSHEDEERFRTLARNATRGIRPFLTDAKRLKSETAIVELCEYVLGLVDERRAAPQDDMISDLLRGQDSAADTTADDIVRIVSALVAAGTGTTSVACARAIRSLLLHPEQLELLRQDRSLLPAAVNELLRFDSGLLVMPRYVVDDFVFGGCAMKKGQLVALGLMGANRDPRVFADPDRLDLRRDTSESLAFGHGPHHCPGSSIARLELRLMLEAALDLLPPGARLLEKEIRWSSRGVMGQIKSLPVELRD